MLNLFKGYATTTKNICSLIESETKTLNTKPINFFTGKRIQALYGISNDKKQTFALSNPDHINLAQNWAKSTSKHFPPASVEWSNSIYSYNKNYIKTLPVLDNIVNKLIKGYFNLKALYNNKKSSAKNIRSNRLSLNRILVSKAEMKHTNNKVIITVYLYNKNQKFLIYKLKELYKTILFGKTELAVKPLNNSNANSLGLNSKNFAQKPFSVVNDINKTPFLLQFSPNKYFFFSAKNHSNKTYLSSGKNTLGLTKAKPFYDTQIRFGQALDFSSKNTGLGLGIIPTNETPKVKVFSLFKAYATNNNKLGFYSYLMSYKYTPYCGFVTNTNLISNSVNLLTRRNSKDYKLSLETPTFSAQALNATAWIVSNKSSRSGLSKIRADISAFGVKITPRLYAPKLKMLYSFFSSIGTGQNNSVFYTKTHNLVQASQLRKNLGLEDNNAKFLLNNMHTIFALKKKSNAFALNSSLKTIKRVAFNSLLSQGLSLNFGAKQFLTKNYLFTKQQIENLEKKTLNVAKVKILKNIYKKELLYLYYVKMLSVNNNKLNHWFILGLKQTISKIYKKKVEFNFVNLKYLHLNSDIFTQAINIKLKNRQNKLLTVLNKALNLVKIPVAFPLKTPFLAQYSAANKISFQNTPLTLGLTYKGKDILHDTIYKIFGSLNVKNTTNSKNSVTNHLPVSVTKDNMEVLSLQDKVLNSTSNKNICGVRLETAGRLSKRLTASRSVFKFKYKGGLKNKDSSNGLSSVMLRGNTKSNIQLTKINSKTRNGSFGLKGWISSY
jgi:hypothetical protein